MQAVGLFDDGTMIVAMNTSFYNRHADQLGKLQPSGCKLQMADGTVVRLQGVWKGRIQVGGIEVETQAEVFRTRHRWEFLVGKPLLQALMAIHEYMKDTITVTDGSRTTCLNNLHIGVTTPLKQGNSKTATEMAEEKQEEKGYLKREGSKEREGGGT
jgi:hypothetical protein